MSSSKSCAVAFHIECNHATFDSIDATPTATLAQPTRLKALAEGVLRRNQRRNPCATEGENIRNFSPETASPKLRTLGVICTEKPTTDQDNPKVEWLRPCPICSGHLFSESNRGGYFCCVCQELPEGTKPARIVEGRKNVNSTGKIVKLSRKQVNCQAYEKTGVFMSTSPEHCRERQGDYCSGCVLMITN